MTRTYSKEQLDAMIAEGLTGPAGAAGPAAYTTTTANFTQPASAATVSVTVGSTAWMATGQYLYIAGGGYYSVSSVTDATHVILTNLGYTGNAAPAATVASGAKVTAAGVQGATGAAGGVSSWNTRTGAVTPASGDYSYGQISGTPAISSQAQADAGTDDTTIMTPLKSANMLRVSPTEVSITGTTTLTSSAFGKMHVCSGTTADYTVLIPTAVGNAGKVIAFRGPAISALNKIVTIDGSGTELVGGAQTLPFTHDWFILIESNGTNWVVLIDQWGRFGSVDAYKSATQAIGAATWTGVKFETESYDTDNWYDASLGRFTPKIPGRYRIGSSVLVQSVAASQIYAVAIEQNAAANPARVLGRQFSVATGQFMSSPSNAVMVANGSTDFYQIILYNGGAVTLASAPSESYFQAEFTGRS